MADGDSSFLKGLLLGGILGGIIGILFAPKSGKELRDDIIGESDEFLDKAKKDFELAKKAALHSYESGRDKVLDKILDKKSEGADREKGEPKTEKRAGEHKKPDKKSETKPSKSSKSKKTAPPKGK